MTAIKDFFLSIWRKIPKPYHALLKLAINYDFRLRKGADILFLGDSVIERTARQDTDKRTVDKMLRDLLPFKRRLVCISQGAYHFNVYLNILRLFRSMQHRPKLVIFPINMRCFSPQWDLNPAYQFEEDIQILKAYPETRRISAIRINAEALPFSEKDWNTEFEFPYTDLKRVGQFFDVINNFPADSEGKFYRRKQIYILHYLKEISRDHRRLVSLYEILELLRELNIRALIYITAINYQGGVRHVGEGFMTGIRKNKKMICDVVEPYTRNGFVRLIDFQESLTSDYFFHADELTEHLNQFGRMKLAQTIASEIESGWND